MNQQTPSPVSLKDAVETVIDQNKGIGYNPTRFTQMTQGSYAENLDEICDRIIQRGETTKPYQANWTTIQTSSHWKT